MACTEHTTHIGWLLNAAALFAHGAFEEEARASGVSVSQAGILLLLADHPGLSGSELVRQMVRAEPAVAAPPLQLSPNTAHRAVATLEERGLVERTPDAHHARIYRYALTGDGRRTAARCQGAWLAIQEAALATFDDGERKAFTDLLERYIEALATID